jgi:hypothetical protein
MYLCRKSFGYIKSEQPIPVQESAAASVIAKQVGLPVAAKIHFFEMSNL